MDRTRLRPARRAVRTDNSLPQSTPKVGATGGASGPPLTVDNVASMRFSISKPSGYFFPQVETFVSQVKETLAFHERATHDLAMRLHASEEERVDAETRAATLQAQVELFRVHGDVLTHEDGSYVTESETTSPDLTAAQATIEDLTARLAAAEERRAESSAAAEATYQFALDAQRRAETAEDESTRLRAALDALHQNRAAVESSTAPYPQPPVTDAVAAEEPIAEARAPLASTDVDIQAQVDEQPGPVDVPEQAVPEDSLWTPPTLRPLASRPVAGTPDRTPVEEQQPEAVHAVEVPAADLPPVQEASPQPADGETAEDDLLAATAPVDGSYGEPAEAPPTATEDRAEAVAADDGDEPVVRVEVGGEAMEFVGDEEHAQHPAFYATFEEEPTLAADSVVTIVPPEGELPVGTVLPPREPGHEIYTYNPASPGAPLTAPDGVSPLEWAPDLDPANIDPEHSSAVGE